MRNSLLVLVSAVGLGLVVSLITPRPVYADIYAYRDASGVLHLSNVKPRKVRGYKRILRGHGTAPGGSVSGNTKSVSFKRLGKSFRHYRIGSLKPIHNTAFDTVVGDMAKRHEVEESLVRAVIHAESAYKPNAVSPVGAAGLMQLMPATAKRFGVKNRFDPTQNISGGVKYLRQLLDLYNQDVRLALAAYNAGEGAVAKYKGVPPYPETRNYVEKVIALRGSYRRLH